MDINYKQIGTRIFLKRKELSITQKELADMINISNNHLSNIENGKAAPSFVTFIEICSSLNTNPDYFISGAIYSDVNDEIINKIKLCSTEDKLKISKIVDVFIKNENT